MTSPEPFFRESGRGPGVVCTHSNASTSSQWIALMERVGPQFHVFAVDSYGAGKSPEWPSDRVITLRDEVALIEPVLAKAGRPLVLVGHSYGAGVALIAALDRPERVRGLALYEPTLFSVIEGEGPAPYEWPTRTSGAPALASTGSIRATSSRRLMTRSDGHSGLFPAP